MSKENAMTLRVESPGKLISQAIEKGSNLEQLEKLLALKERYEAGEAKKIYVKAMTAFKAEAPKVTKDKNNKQYNSKYTSLSNLVNTVNPVLSKHGLSASWDIEQNGIIKVSCRITHEFGHSEVASASAPADVSGAKNAIQQIKSTITYLKAVTFESICGLASSDANLDDDGNIVGVEYIDNKQLGIIRDLLTAIKRKEVDFSKYLKIESLDKMPKTLYAKAETELKAALKVLEGSKK